MRTAGIQESALRGGGLLVLGPQVPAEGGGVGDGKLGQRDKSLLAFLVRDRIP